MKIQKLATHLPARMTPLASLKEACALSDAQLKIFQRYHGLQTVALQPGANVLDLLCGAIEKLPGGLDPARVRILIYCHTVQENSPLEAELLSKIKERFMLTQATAFSLTMGHCASSLLALQTIRLLLSNDAGAQALLLAGEKCFHPSVHVVPGSAVMSEGAAAVLLGHGADRDELLHVESTQLGKYSLAPQSLTRELLQDWGEEYISALEATLRRAIDRAGLSPRDIQLILPHNVNPVSLRKLARGLKLDEERFFAANIGTIGHSFCADPFINLKCAVDDGMLRPGDHYLLTSAGLGATFATAVFRH